MKTRELTHTAISLSLITISFILFKGTTNVFNAVTVPTILYLNYSKFSLREYTTLVLLNFIMALLFFFQQLFFIFFYAVMAVLIKRILRQNYSKFFSFLILAVGFGGGFYFTLTLTDTILGTALRNVLASVAAGNPILLILLYSFTSSFVAAALILIIPEIDKRL